MIYILLYQILASAIHEKMYKSHAKTINLIHQLQYGMIKSLDGSYPVLEYYLKLLTPETTELLGSTTNKITKHENGENISHQY